jgi:hypothetical protein
LQPALDVAFDQLVQDTLDALIHQRHSNIIRWRATEGVVALHDIRTFSSGQASFRRARRHRRARPGSRKSASTALLDESPELIHATWLDDRLPALEPARRKEKRKAAPDASPAQNATSPARSAPPARTESPCTGTGRSESCPRQTGPWDASGSQNAYADDARLWEVGRPRSTHWNTTRNAAATMSTGQLAKTRQ